MLGCRERTQASFIKYRVGKLSVPSMTMSWSRMMSMALSDEIFATTVLTLQNGLISAIFALADSTLSFPRSDVKWMTCRCRFDSSTRSKSTSVSSPTPAADRYIASGDPSPPAPLRIIFKFTEIADEDIRPGGLEFHAVADTARDADRHHARVPPGHHIGRAVADRADEVRWNAEEPGGFDETFRIGFHPPDRFGPPDEFKPAADAQALQNFSREGPRLVGDHGQLLGRKPIQRFAHAVVENGRIEAMRVVPRIEILRRRPDRLRVVGLEGPAEKFGQSVADEGPNNFLGHARPAAFFQDMIDGGRQVRNGIDEGAVEVKDNRLNLPLRYYGHLKRAGTGRRRRAGRRCGSCPPCF